MESICRQIATTRACLLSAALAVTNWLCLARLKSAAWQRGGTRSAHRPWGGQHPPPLRGEMAQAACAAPTNCRGSSSFAGLKLGRYEVPTKGSSRPNTGGDSL